METKKTHKTAIYGALIGALIGIFVLHPFSMAIYHMMMVPCHYTGPGEALMMSLDAFTFPMWLMAAFYAALGGLFGFSVGLLMQRNCQLLTAKLEQQHHDAARKLIEEIVLTVSHYVRNANSAIGGYSRLAMKSSKDESVSRRLRVVIESSTQIDAVMAALQSVDEKIEREEIGTTQLRMLNIRDQINAYLREKPVSRLADAAAA